jgi:formylglycine-generating enzyme required for sulfatase activity
VPTRIAIQGGSLSVSVDDWDLLGRARPDNAVVGSFWLDRYEVTERGWAECAHAGKCSARDYGEAGLPVSSISAEAAAGYCAFRAGRLPTLAEWLWAARGADGRRYPWGSFGLVCRRAVFGLQSGPCGEAGVSPDVPGSRPDGASPEGVEDLAGNVAEWVVTQSPNSYAAAGGSFVSRVAAELKSSGTEELKGPRVDVGFRCAYDH